MNAENKIITRDSTANIFLEEIKYDKDEFVLLKIKLSKAVEYRVFYEFDIYEKFEDYFIAEIMQPKGDWAYYFISSFGEHCQVLEPLNMGEDFKK